jgi:hypothetical protein
LAFTLDAWYLPSRHEEHAVAREVNSSPLAQNEQLTLSPAFSCWYLPESQARHEVFVDVNDLPAAHVAQFP